MCSLDLVEQFSTGLKQGAGLKWLVNETRTSGTLGASKATTNTSVTAQNRRNNNVVFKRVNLSLCWGATYHCWLTCLESVPERTDASGQD